MKRYFIAGSSVAKKSVEAEIFGMDRVDGIVIIAAMSDDKFFVVFRVVRIDADFSSVFCFAGKEHIDYSAGIIVKFNSVSAF